MLKMRDNKAQVMGDVKTTMSSQFPEDANLAVRIVKTMSGEDFEVYINPKRAYNTLMYRKYIVGGLNAAFSTLLKTLMSRIIFDYNKEGAYNSFLGFKIKRDEPLLAQDKTNDIDISKEIKTKIQLLKRELEFSDREAANALYGRFDELMQKMEAIVDEIIMIKEIEERKNNNK